MRCAVISDIHNNKVMLFNAIQDAIENGAERFVFLGDYVTDGYCGDEVIGCLKALSEKYPCDFILGNREKYIKSYDPEDTEMNKRINKKALGYETLSKESLEWINNLPETKTIDIDGLKVLLVHGDHFDRTVDIRYNYQNLLEKYDFDACLFGHIHEPKNDVFKGKTFVNPGTVSYPENGSVMSYCYFDTNTNGKMLDVTFKYVKPTKEVLDAMVKMYVETGFYQENPIWSEFLINYMRDSVNHITQFIVPFHHSIDVKNISSDDYNRLFTLGYKNYSELFNFSRINVSLTQTIPVEKIKAKNNKEINFS